MGQHRQLRAADGFAFGVYEAAPDGEPKGAVVVIQEIFGVNAHIREVADGYAADGYAVLAPALFDRVERGVELGYDADGMGRGRDIAFNGLVREDTLARPAGDGGGGRQIRCRGRCRLLLRRLDDLARGLRTRRHRLRVCLLRRRHRRHAGTRPGRRAAAEVPAWSMHFGALGRPHSAVRRGHGSRPPCPTCPCTSTMPTTASTATTGPATTRSRRRWRESARVALFAAHLRVSAGVNRWPTVAVGGRGKAVHFCVDNAELVVDASAH